MANLFTFSCLSCGKDLQNKEFKCSNCGALLPINTFNYFELFSLKKKQNIDMKELDNNYLNLQKNYHPDFYVNSEREDDRLIAVTSTIYINSAYNCLKDNRKRAEYLLLEKGYRINSESDNISPEQSVLEEVMKIRENIFEYELSELNMLKKKCLERNEALLKEFDSDFEGGKFEDACQSIIMYRYIEKILEEIIQKQS